VWFLLWLKLLRTHRFSIKRFLLREVVLCSLFLFISHSRLFEVLGHNFRREGFKWSHWLFHCSHRSSRQACGLCWFD
jgi:hypothetical protein